MTEPTPEATGQVEQPVYPQPPLEPEVSPWDEEEGAMVENDRYLRAMGWGDHT